MVILYAFQDEMVNILKLHRLRDVSNWGKEMVRRRRQGETVPTTEAHINEPQPRGLRKLGLRWRGRRQVFEEDGLSVRSINGERKPKSHLAK